MRLSFCEMRSPRSSSAPSQQNCAPGGIARAVQEAIRTSPQVTFFLAKWIFHFQLLFRSVVVIFVCRSELKTNQLAYLQARNKVELLYTLNFWVSELVYDFILISCCFFKIDGEINAINTKSGHIRAPTKRKVIVVSTFLSVRLYFVQVIELYGPYNDM